VKRLVCLLSILLLTFYAAAQSAAPNRSLTIEGAYAEGGITGRAPETIQWSPDGSKVSFILRDDSGDHGQLWYADAATGEKKVLVSEVKLAALAPSLDKIKDEREKERVSRYHVAGYQWAPDSKHLLFDSQGQLWLYTIESATAVQLTSSADASNDAKFSPDGKTLTYVRKHNLFSRSVESDNEKQLTDDKDADLLNGEVDWVYAEELDVRGNYFWSPNGRDIVFLQMNEKSVPTYPITDWMPTHPVVDQEKYPKAGDPNPVVRLGVVSAGGGKAKWISLTDDADTYIPRFGWVRDGVLWAEVLNRHQDNLDLYFIDARSGRWRKVLTESAPDAWVHVNDDFKILKSGDRFTWPSWRDGNTHLYLYSFNKENPLAADAKLEVQLTKGDFEVLKLDAIDDAAGLVYFTCNKDDPRQRQLYSAKLNGSGLQRVSQEDGTHEPTFADDAKHYVDDYSAILTPPSLSACTPGSGCKKVWGSRPVDEFRLTPPTFSEFKAEDGTKLYGELIMPLVATPPGRVPLVVYIYGGPAAQTVLNEWMGRELFHEILAQQGIAVFTLDNRGTPGRDRKFQTAIRHEYGEIELRDQLAALDQLFEQNPQLDRSHVAIWGWSNGGSMTLYSMMHSDRFKAGVSVSPVTDWRNYDSIYTERYQGLPKENGKGYQDLRLADVAGKLSGSLLLVHGTSDDNVHFQNSVQMVEGFIKAGKQFRFMVYPGKTHGISGAADQTHLFHMIDDHLLRELK
jgi:dipeptidyl-peptidase-4